MAEEKTPTPLYKRVLYMMDEQKKYFELRKKNLPGAAPQLKKCKEIEKEVYTICKEMEAELEKTKTLFDQ